MIASFLVASCVFSCALSFSITKGDVILGRGHALSTASLNRISSGFGGVIPRLEPGLRWIGDRAQHISKLKLSTESTPFYYLDGSESLAAAPAAMTFGIAQMLGLALTKHTKLLIVAILLLLSGSSFTGLPVFASAAGIGSPASQPVVRIEPTKPLLSRLLNFELNLFKFKKYSQLTPMERLATTPVFYMANSRGNAYLQADTQVCACTPILPIAAPSSPPTTSLSLYLTGWPSGAEDHHLLHVLRGRLRLPERNDSGRLPVTEWPCSI